MSRPSHLPRPVWITAVVAGLLALHWWLGVTGWFGKSVTSDETAHLVSGYSYWKFNDYRLQPENGNLPQRWAALPLLLQNPRLVPTDEPLWWELSNVWELGQRFFFESGNNTDFMLATARGSMALWSVGLGLVVFTWSRRLWGDLGGLFSLTLYVFSPTLLAHGPLVTSDTTAAFFILVATAAFWRYVSSPSPARLALSLACTGFATVAKFSFIVLGPVYLLLLGLHLLLRWRESRGLDWRHGSRLLAVVISHVVVAWTIVWICFGFRYSGFAPGMPAAVKYYYPWEELLTTQTGWRDLLTQVKSWRLLPEAYVHGFAYVLHASEARGAFLAGNYSQTGWWWFFPYAFLIKTPLAELLAYVSAGAMVLWSVTHRSTSRLLDGKLVLALPLIVLLLVYWVVSVTSNLNIGHRHLLPTYPPLMILVGCLAGLEARRWVKIGALALGLGLLGESMHIRPHYLTFFNPLVGGPTQGWKHLVDSSLDWGQDLPALSLWLEENRSATEPVYLSYFGMGDPAYEGIDAHPLAPYYYHYRPRHWQELSPGIYCLSATMLQDPYSPWNGPWTARHETAYQYYLRTLRAEIAQGKTGTELGEFGQGPSKPLWTLDRLRFARLCIYLRVRTPDAMVANTFLIYQLGAEEIHTAVDGSTEDLAELMDRQIGR